MSWRTVFFSRKHCAHPEGVRRAARVDNRRGSIEQPSMCSPARGIGRPTPVRNPEQQIDPAGATTGASTGALVSTARAIGVEAMLQRSGAGLSSATSCRNAESPGVSLTDGCAIPRSH